MRFLEDALARRRAGWCQRHEIIDRAGLMLDHAKAGNRQRAEEYAVEIEALQRAEDEWLGPGVYFDRRETYDWPVGMSHADWAAAIIKGGWMVHRRVHPNTIAMAVAAE